ncbi:MAG: hypothetical protein AAJB65_00440 [Candidatus Hodgkinia cicadicola]
MLIACTNKECLFLTKKRGDTKSNAQDINTISYITLSLMFLPKASALITLK